MNIAPLNLNKFGLRGEIRPLTALRPKESLAFTRKPPDPIPWQMQSSFLQQFDKILENTYYEASITISTSPRIFKIVMVLIK